MAVEYRASTMTNMDVDNSTVGYKQFFGDGSKVQYSVFALKNSPFKAATVGLGLLCVLLLAGVIGQSVHYQKVEQDHQNNLKAKINEIQKVQDDLKVVKSEKRNVETSRNQLQQRSDYLNKRVGQIQTNNNLLSQETNRLKVSQSQLQTTNNALSKELQQLKTTKDQLQTQNDALTTARDSLEKQYDSVLKVKNDVQANYDLVVKDRDNLKNKVNNVTRARDHLQTDYIELVKKVEHLQDKFNFSSSEKDKLEKHHQNVTLSKEALQAQYDTLSSTTDELRALNAAMAQEKTELETKCQDSIVERDQLRVKNHNLTTEKDKLLAEIQRLTSLVPARKCSTGWTLFKQSCYFTAVGKSTWNNSRKYCQSQGADLAIVTTAEEMAFINGLYASDKEVWIGLTDDGIEGDWKWVDGKALTTKFWAKGQPNSFDGRNQDCVEFWHRATGIGDWNDEHCDIEQNFICEM